MSLGKYVFKDVEEGVLSQWTKNKVYKKSVEKNKKGKNWFFLQGPPYANGRIHVGTAWNTCLKDMSIRYRRMQGYKVWDRAGYDTHGLPIERQVEKMLNLSTKAQIEKFGVGKFNTECKEFCLKMAKQMSIDFQRMGAWLDFDNAYMPITPEYMEGVWYVVKRAQERNLLYKGERSLMWCYSCETACSKHEVEYEDVTEPSIFVKLALADKPHEFLVIWTTTPWTIPFNLGVMVHPDFDYVRAKVGKEIWIVAKGLAGGVITHVAEEKFEIVQELKGADLKGLRYVHPFVDTLGHIYSDLHKKSDKVHTVVLSDVYVDLGSGSGLVHMAPGCGPADWEVGHREGIPAFNNLSEGGVYPQDMGEFSGYHAKKDNKEFVEALKARGALIAVNPITHEYPHCQRCHNPVLFRATTQWFFKLEALREKMLSVHHGTYWNPQEAKNAFTGWLSNLRDNSITKQRFWGTPVPIWECDKCEHYEVVGSVAELKKLCGKVPKDLHKPWIDELTAPCTAKSCKGTMRRVPDVLDVWVDAGCASWACLDFPQTTKNFDELYPADFICEGKDQIRGWFNLLMQCSFLAFDRPSFKNVYMHGFITDVEGTKMSKSLGNILSPVEVMDKYGADTFRYYCCQQRAGYDMKFSWAEIDLRHKNLHVLWNVAKFLVDHVAASGLKPAVVFDDKLVKKYEAEEKYITSLYNSTVKKMTELNEEYRLDETVKPLEELFLELSRTYIQFVREKASLGTDEEKKVVAHCIFNVLIGVVKLGSPLIPFITDEIYGQLRDVFGLKEESVHLCSWPKADESLIDSKLESSVGFAQDVIQGILAGREKLKIGRRWPLKEVVIETALEELHEQLYAIEDIVKSQANVKDMKIEKEFPLKKFKLRADFGKLGPAFGQLTPKIIAKLVQTAPEVIKKHLDADGSFGLLVDKQKVELKPEHFVVEFEVAEPWTAAAFKKGTVYVNSTRTPELELEGFARELVRQIQDNRKQAGLSKEDTIVCYVVTSMKGLDKLDHDIAQRVGADKVTISDKPCKEKMQHKFEAVVKDEKFEISFSKK